MQTATKNAVPASVDAYLHGLDEQQRTALSKLRQTIRSIVPQAEEVISYQVPTFKYKGGLVAFGAAKNHLALYVMSSTLLKDFSAELQTFDTAPGTIRFTAGKSIPATLIKKIVKARMKENEAIDLARKNKATLVKNAVRKKIADAEIVAEYMDKLDHPLKAEIEAVRTIIKNANSKIAERIKWNAPSYYYKDDLVTFNHRDNNRVHLVFHHPEIVHISSPLLQGDYKDRRMLYLQNMQQVKTQKKELEKIMNELIKRID